MKKFSKVLGLVLAISMLISCLPAQMAFAADAQEKTETKAEKTIEDYPKTALALDVTDSKKLAQLSLSTEKKIVNNNEVSAKWEFSKKRSITFDSVTDLAGFETIEMYIYGDKDHPARAMMYISADDPDSEGMDYYGGDTFAIKEGWNLYTFSLSKLATQRIRNPLNFHNTKGIVLNVSGWGLDAVNDLENTVLYLDSIVLRRGKEVIDTTPPPPPEKKPEGEAGKSKYIDFEFEEEKIADVKGATAYPKGNIVEIEKDADSKKSYVKIEKVGTTTDCHLDVGFKNTGRYIVIQADYMSTGIGEANLCTAKDVAGKQNVFASMNNKGKVVANKEEITTMTPGKWVNIAVCADVENHEYSVYVDGKLVKEKIDFINQNLTYLTSFRALVGQKMVPGTNLCIDNFRIYDGKTPDDYAKATEPPPATGPNTIDVTQEREPNVITVENDAVADVSDAVCLKVNCPTALVYHEQKYIDENNKSVVPMIVNSRTLVPVRFISESFGAEVGWDDATKTVTVKKDSDVLEFVIGSNIIKKNGKEITIDVPAEIYFDRTMLPLRAVTENLGKKVFWDDMGLIIISDKEFNYNKKDDLATMIDIMQSFIYERPTREQIKADILKTTPNHPRVYATKDDFDRIRSYAQTDAEFKKWIDVISDTADKYVQMAVNDTEAKPFLYSQNAGGTLVDPTNIVSKAPALGMMYQLTGDKKYVDAMWYTLEDMCDAEKWPHWGAGHFLNSAALMEAVAIAYDWMYDAWTAEQKSIIEKALYDCGIEDGISAYYGADDHLMPPMSKGNRSGWTTWDSNWNSVCNGGVMVAGAAMATHEKYGDLAVKAMEYALRSNEIGLRCYAPDGGYQEGLSYWDFGTCGAVRLMCVLQSACGTKNAYGMANSPGMDLTWKVPIFSESKLAAFNYGDNSEERSTTRLVMWFGNTYDKKDATSLRYNELVNGEKESTFWDVLWYRQENIVPLDALPLDVSFFAPGTAMLRSSWTDQNQVFAGIHGGYNAAGHADIDSGTFVYDSDGERWFIDLGADEYTLSGYFQITVGGGRWKYYSKRGEGQNVYVINPTAAEEQDVLSRAYITAMESKPRGAYVKLDLSDAYSEEVTKAERGIMLAANRKAFVLQDEIEMKKPSEFYWFAHTRAEIKVSEDGKSAILSQNGKKLFVELLCEQENLKFSVMDAVSLPTSPEGNSKEKSRAGIRKLVIHGNDVEKVKLAIACTPLYGEDRGEYRYTLTDMANWSVPDGEMIYPKLEGLSVDGVPVENFDKDVASYSLLLPYGTEKFPEIVATADENSVCEIKSAPESLPGTAVVRVSDKEDKSMYSTYYVYVRARDEVEIEVSSAQEGNPGQNSLDKDLSTRWAAEGESWGIFRFANPKTISSVWLATWKAAARQLIFDIEVSEDGENFKQVWSGKTTATEDVLEEIKIPEGTYKAVKLVLHGTTAGAWNSILEVEFK